MVTSGQCNIDKRNAIRLACVAWNKSMKGKNSISGFISAFLGKDAKQTWDISRKKLARKKCNMAYIPRKIRNSVLILRMEQDKTPRKRKPSMWVDTYLLRIWPINCMKRKRIE